MRNTLLGAATAVALGLPASAAAATPAQIHAFLNQQRAANGIPIAAFNQRLSDGCANHNNYMRLNGYVQGEQPGRPGYTPVGAEFHTEALADARRVPPWSATSNPWITAPVHLALLFGPQASQAGGADTYGFNCVRLDWRRTFAVPTLNLFTGPTGRVNVPTRQVAVEDPDPPQTLVGIPEGRATGFQLIAFADGLGETYRPGTNQVQSASLQGPSGPVEVRVVDKRYPGWGVTNTAVLVPVKPFAPLATYTGQVTWVASNGRPFSQSFSFRTAVEEPLVELELSFLRLGGPNAVLRLRASKPGLRRRASVRAYVRRRGRLRPTQRKTIKRLRRKQTIRVRWHYGEMQVRVKTKAFTRKGVRYPAATTSTRFFVRRPD